MKKTSQKQGSNPQPSDYKSVALPVELFWHISEAVVLNRSTLRKNPPTPTNLDTYIL